MPLSGSTMSVTNTYTPGAVITASGFNTNFTDFATTISTVLTTSMPLGNGAVISWNSGDVTLTHSANVLAFAGASSGYTFDAAVKPASSDGAALGSASVMWSDLFLASGAVINFNNGDVTVAHGANNLVFGGASGGYGFDAVVYPTVSDGAALGSTALQWSDLFLAEGGVINWDNGDVTLTQSGNSLTVAGGNLIFPGTATNDSAAAGQVGEYATNTASSVALVTNTAKTVTSVSLTAGDWDVEGRVLFSPAGTTTLAAVIASINTTDNVNGGIPAAGQELQLSFTTGNAQAITTGRVRISIAGTTTVYLVGLAVFGVSTLTADGFIGARRVR